MLLVHMTTRLLRGFVSFSIPVLPNYLVNYLLGFVNTIEFLFMGNAGERLEFSEADQKTFQKLAHITDTFNLRPKINAIAEDPCLRNISQFMNEINAILKFIEGQNVSIADFEASQCVIKSRLDDEINRSLKLEAVVKTLTEENTLLKHRVGSNVKASAQYTTPAKGILDFITTRLLPKTPERRPSLGHYPDKMCITPVSSLSVSATPPETPQRKVDASLLLEREKSMSLLDTPQIMFRARESQAGEPNASRRSPTPNFMLTAPNLKLLQKKKPDECGSDFGSSSAHEDMVLTASSPGRMDASSDSSVTK